MKDRNVLLCLGIVISALGGTAAGLNTGIGEGFAMGAFGLIITGVLYWITSDEC